LSEENEFERYNYIQEKSGLTKRGFAESLGLSKSHGFQIGAGRLKPSREVLERLSSVYHVNLHWFITGEGSSGLEEDIAHIELLVQEAAAGQGKEIEDYPMKRMFQVPRSFVAPYRPEKLRAVYVAGDSMAGEKIDNGDIVIFHLYLTEGNGIYVVSIGNTLVVKRVDFDTTNRTIVLISANPAYEPRYFSGSAFDELRIVGRVIACIHRV
jgi:SOS-response transcriptional repressor LexA